MRKLYLMRLSNFGFGTGAKILLFVWAVLGLLANNVYAQLLTKNTFDGSTGTCPTQGNSFTSTSPINATVAAMSRQGVICTTAGGVFNSTTLNNTASRNDNSYIEFSITANSGYKLNLTQLSFLRRASDSAPNTLIVSYSTDGFVTRVDREPSTTPTTPAAGALLDWTFASPITTASGGTVTFRFYPYGTTRADGGTAAAAATGTFRLDDVSLFGTIEAASDVPPTVVSTNPANSAINVAPNANISVTFSEGVTAGTNSFSVVGSASGTHTFALTGGSTSYTLNPDTDFTDGETVTVTALAAQIADQDGTADNMASDYTFSYSASVSKIHGIQGTGATFNPAYGGVPVQIEGIVTRVFAGTTYLNGFYMQEEDADVDADPLTSEGIFIYDPSGVFTGNEGDKVQVTGMVAEYTSGSNSSLTQISNPTSVITLSTNNTLPTATTVALPVTNVSDLEAYEGMLVTLKAATGNLTVTEHYQLGQYGQIVLSAMGASNQTDTDARLDQYTQFNSPSVSGYAAYQAELAKRKIYLDDAKASSYPDPIIFGRGGNPLSASNTLRAGDEVTNITTVLDHRYEGYRLQTNKGSDANFIATNARPTSSPDVGGTLKVASANVLNYFNGDGAGGGFPTARGATTAAEFTRQRNKVLQNLYNSGADIIGLMEVENDGYGSASAIQDLVNGLNTLAGTTSYTFVNPGTSIATDAITVGMIYKSAIVTTVGIPASLSTNADFNGVGRRPLAQTFRQKSTGGVVTVVVNHFKSKGSSQGGTGDADISDGQGASNGTRTRQAQALTAWLATKPTGVNDADYLIVGDLNSYAKEDPIAALESAGYTNLLPETTYSYVFDGQWGSLDHALGSSSLQSQVTGAKKWHINADEPSILDYNVENKTTAQQASLYSPDQFRSSDHDPVLVGLNLTPSPLPDLIARMVTQPTIAYGQTDISVVVDVFEVKNQPTDGTITVRVTKDTAVPLSFDSGATSVGGKSVQNSKWTFDASNTSYYKLTTTTSLLGNQQLSFGLSGAFTPNGSGTLGVSAVVLGGGEGNNEAFNNTYAESIDYFQQ